MALNKKFEIEDGVTLYNSGPSPCARRVRIFLLVKNIPHRKVEVDLTSQEQKTEEYKNINPNGKVPALAIKNVPNVPDCVLNESNVITEFIDSVFPGPKLYPEDDWLRCQTRMWQDWELSLVDDFVPIVYTTIIGPLMRMMYGSREKYEKSFPSSMPETRKDVLLKCFDGTYKTHEELEQLSKMCYKQLLVLEKALEGKEYLVGEGFSAADVSVLPRVMMFPDVGMPLTRFPNVTRYIQTVGKSSCFRDSKDMKTRVMEGFISTCGSVVNFIGNFRSGGTHTRFDGSHLAEKVLSEYQSPKTEEERSTDSPCLIFIPLATECWQAKLLLNEKKTEFETREADVINLIGRPYGSEGLFRYMNGERTVTGIRAVLEYIDNTGQGKAYIPSDPLKRTEVQCWQAWEQTMYWQDMFPMVERLVYSRYLANRYKDKPDDLLSLKDDPKHKEHFQDILATYLIGHRLLRYEAPGAVTSQCTKTLPTDEELANVREMYTQAVRHRLQYLEVKLKGTPYLAGSDVTLADVCVFCRLQLLTLLDIEISEEHYPSVLKWIEDLQKKSSFAEISAFVKQQKQFL